MQTSGTKSEDGSGSDGGGGGDGVLDLLWLDFGVGVGGRLAPFLDAWWPRIRAGGYLLVHSTLGNAVTRKWVDGMRARRSPGSSESTLLLESIAEDAAQAPVAGGVPGITKPSRDVMGAEFETLSFMEPHKKFQSSVSLFQRRPDGWGEPIHTMYP
mmetsp:Transcript_43525/g.128107  ORF Transcript_43525/g.128107 Transcript_43525/m.128107 type:complete len:156 (+) Transcript_43525:166-633(+)